MTKRMRVVQTLTVTDGRNIVGTINELEGRRFQALDIVEETVGIFGSRAEAAQAISTRRNSNSEGA